MFINIRFFIFISLFSLYSQLHAFNINSYIEENTKKWDVPGLSIGIIENNKIIFQKSYGVKNIYTQEKVNNFTAFKIASLTKAFTATLAVKLEEEKKINLNDSLIKYVDYLDPTKHSDIKLYNLLNHTSDFTRYAGELSAYKKISQKELFKEVFEHPKKCEVNQCYQYQNVIFNFIKDTFEVSSNDNFVHLMDTRILRPLEMNHTIATANQWPKLKNKALGHVKKKNKLIPIESHNNYDNVISAASISSNIIDMTKWLHANINSLSSILSESQFKKLITPTIITTEELSRFDEQWRKERLNTAHYGLGWRVFNYQGHKLIYHSGLVNGFSSTIAFLPNKKTGIVILTNSKNGVTDYIMASYFDNYLKIKNKDWSQLALNKKQANKLKAT